ncbi:MAG: hypothetical protein R6U96_01740 [Promethearchaeia archaeon]
MAKKMTKLKNFETFKEEEEDDNFVRVPVNKINEKNEPVREFKTFKIVERLE